MRVLLDTNVLLKSTVGTAAEQAVILNAVGTLRGRGDELVICLQNLTEFWQNATKATSYGLPVADADRLVADFLRDFTFLLDPTGTLAVWRRLVVSHGIRGTLVHDARLAATALAAGVPAVLTFNTGDFARFAADGLTALDPAAV